MTMIEGRSNGKDGGEQQLHQEEGTYLVMEKVKKGYLVQYSGVCINLLIESTIGKLNYKLFRKNNG